MLRRLAIVMAAFCAITSLNAHAQTQNTAPGTVFKDCADCPQMVVIERGTFQMGSETPEIMRTGEVRSQGPVRNVTIGYRFAAGRFEVTNAEWAAFIRATGHATPEGCVLWGQGQDIPTPGKTWRDPDYGRPPAENEPVVCVNWRDAKAYVAWLSETTGQAYRLLSEAEWEYIAREGQSTLWPWGTEETSLLCRFGNVFDQTGAADPRNASTNTTGIAPCDDGYALVSPVGRFAPNRFGVYDTFGNVWEWAEDCSLAEYPPQPVDGGAVESPSGACERRAVRGGSWRTRIVRQQPHFRGRDPEPLASQIFGLRVARELPGAPR
jgi:formylglycine-generating enzyme required for sulfatase activity